MAALPFKSVKLNDRPRQYRCPRDWSCHLRLSDHDLWMVLGGKGMLRIDGSPLPIRAPMAVLLCPGEVVLGEQDPSAPLEVVALHFSVREGRTEKVREWAGRMRSVPLSPAATWRELAEWMARQLSASDELAAQQGEALALAVLAGLWRRACSARVVEIEEDRVEELVRLIQREPERPWSVAEMTRRARTGATRLNSRFRQITGLSPARWVIRCRLERAAMLLLETPMKTAAIADACGYADVFFFSRQFRQVMGRPPGEWRRTMRFRGIP